MTPSPSAEDKVRLCARAALEKKAEGVVVLDLQGISAVADFFLLASAQSTTQIKTIVEAIEQALEPRGVRVRHTEGVPESGWLLLDYGDVVVHVFLEETRTFYALERLWGDAPVLSVEG
ncbi:MAG: ribosome silencing factor [Candidatus Rokubacteria bacterium]|nr:ribosome silencing factor [Candidatus Rokubacteria bacterium]